jgi:hypothetical protein
MKRSTVKELLSATEKNAEVLLERMGKDPARE